MALSFSRDRSRALPLAAEIGALGVVFGDIGTSPLYALKQGVWRLAARTSPAPT